MYASFTKIVNHVESKLRFLVNFIYNVKVSILESPF